MRMAKGEAGTGAKAAEVVANSQFVGVGTSSLTFGYGRHACPGRFFAVNEIKMIMAQAILQYEVRNVDGVTERYPNKQVGSSVWPPQLLGELKHSHADRCDAVHARPQQDRHDSKTVRVAGV